MSLIEQLHQAHKARQARISRAAARLAVKGCEPDRPIADVITEMETIESYHERWLATNPSARILKETATAHGMTVKEMLRRDNSTPYVEARCVVIGLCLELTNLSLTRIGRLLDGRDHTTVIHGRKRLAKMMLDEGLRNRYEHIKERLLKISKEENS